MKTLIVSPDNGMAYARFDSRKPSPKILLALTAAAALIAYPASVQADPITYMYTGNPFTDVNGPYTTSDFVTALVRLASPLAPNMPLTTVSPIAFTLSDGVQTITNLSNSGFLFQFATGPHRRDYWLVHVGLLRHSRRAIWRN